MLTSMVDLTQNEHAGLRVIEITEIPHKSILENRFPPSANIDLEYKHDMVRLLSEVYQTYKNLPEACRDISLELLWSANQVSNQTYKASLRLHLILRAIGTNAIEIDRVLSALVRTCQTTLDFEKYDYKQIEYGELAKIIRKISNEAVKAVVKSERLENLQNPVFPFCLSFSRIPQTENDLSRIVNALINYPGSAISFQLIPITYNTDEAAAIDANAQMLGTLSKGVMDRGMGNISFSSAEVHAETYSYYSQNKNNALFAFNILVYADKQISDNIATRIQAQLNAGGELRIIALSPKQVGKDENFYPLPWAVNEIILNTDRNPEVWDSRLNLRVQYNLPYLITAEEASEFFRLPIGSEAVYAGLAVNESSKSSRTYFKNIIGGGDLSIGKLKSSPHGDMIGIMLNDLTKHALVVGTPGSGKTTFTVGLLDRLWKDHGIPFMVIEPAKNEYRAMIKSIPELQVFTPGKNAISPFRINPFLPPENVKLEAYKSTLKTAFAAAVSMSTPLDKIFEMSINNCYSDFKWLDTYTADDNGQIFNIADFIKCFQETFDEIGYTGDAQNIGRAGVVRLQSLENLFDNYFSIPVGDLLSKPTVIELAAIENSEQKALIISLLLLSVLAYVNSNYLGDGKLRNVLVLEEAHVLLDTDTVTMPGEANPAAIAQRLIKRMLAEIRSYGVGMIIADQSPRKVTSDVVALTDIKMTFRIVESDDKQIVADSTNMPETQMKRLARLKTGEAFLFFSKLDEPEELIIDDYRSANGIDISISDEEIKLRSTYWNDKENMLRPYPECACSKYCAQKCDYARRLFSREAARRIFRKYFNNKSCNIDTVKQVFRNITNVILRELDVCECDTATIACIEIHLLRHLKYATKIKISDPTVKKTISGI